MSQRQAVQQAVADALSLPAAERPFIRYLWCPDGQFKAANLALNIIARGAVPVRARVLTPSRVKGLPGGTPAGVLLRVDVRSYARFFPGTLVSVPNPDVADWLKYWEYMKYDPTFNLLVTKDNVDFATYQKQVKDTGQAEDDIIRLNPDYVPELGKLQELLHSEAPILLDRYFMSVVLHTIKKDPVRKDDNAYTAIWGGLYYEFRGIKRSKEKGTTDEDLFLHDFGIDNREAFFDRLGTDQRSALFRSGVTGRQRRVDFFNTPGGRAWDIMGVGSITHDIRQEDIDTGTHPLMNLLTFKDQAREDIFVSANGMHAYAIFDGQGRLLDEAAPNIVSDRTVPEPHPPRLQCALSCIACHEAEGSDGWKQIGNDVKKLLGNRVGFSGEKQLPGLDIVADLHSHDQVGALNRLAGLYLGDFKKGMQRSRDDYAQAVLKASGPWGDDQAQIVKTAMSTVTKMTRDYIYGEVTPEQALRELGVELNGNSAEQLSDLLPPEPAQVGFLPEDPRVAALKKGIPIPRTDWSFVQSFCASRIAKRGKK